MPNITPYPLGGCPRRAPLQGPAGLALRPRACSVAVWYGREACALYGANIITQQRRPPSRLNNNANAPRSTLWARVPPTGRHQATSTNNKGAATRPRLNPQRSGCFYRNATNRPANRLFVSISPTGVVYKCSNIGAVVKDYLTTEVVSCK